MLYLKNNILHFKNYEIPVYSEKIMKNKLPKVFAINVSNVSDLNYYLNKGVFAIINPFNDKKRHFDANVLNVIAEKNIFLIIDFSYLKNLNNLQEMYFLRNAYILSKLAKKKKIPVLVMSNMQFYKKQEFSLSIFLDLSYDQIKMFFDMFEVRLNEKKA